MTSGTGPDAQAPFARIVPQAPPLAAAAGATPRGTPEPGLSPRGVGIALALTLGLAALVFVLLPDTQTAVDRASDHPTSAVAATAPGPASASASPPESPPAAPAIWDDAALLEARAAAQALQKRVTEASAQLSSQGVETWAGAAYAQAALAAQAGRNAFDARDFNAARSAYESAATQLETLLQEAAQQLSTALRKGSEALERADRPEAERAYSRALLIEPANVPAQKGLARSRQLDAVIAKLQTARRLEQIADQTGAEAAYREALQLDPETTEAREALARLEAARNDREFRRLLGEAFEALDRGDLARAGARIGSARRLRASDPGLSQAQARLAEAGRSGRLVQLETEAAVQVQAEDWAGAVKTYRSALEIDPSVAYARDGLAQAEPRAQLATALETYINRPDRLVASAVSREAVEVLGQARAVAAPGPRLRAQIASLETAIARAAQPVRLQLRSDNQTEVTIYRVGPQGRFAERELELQPGRYVAVGTRAGYRDVRREFEVAAGSAAAVEIRCEEPL